ncbi:hypothetical protein ABK040_013878 [Willaertia magna]
MSFSFMKGSGLEDEFSKLLNPIPPAMGAIYYQKYGDVNVFEYSNKYKVPTLKEKNQVLVKILYTSLNPLDIKIRNGNFKNIMYKPEFPLIPCVDMSGIVVQSNSNKFKVGDEVFGINGKGGCCSSFNIMEDESICVKPKELSHLTCSTIPLIGLTAHQSLVEIGKIEKDKKVLILGASGNVGSYCTQYAKKVLGAQVYAVTSKEEYIQELKNKGAYQVDLLERKEDKDLDKKENEKKNSLEDIDNLPFEYNIPDVDVIIDCIGDKEIKNRTWKLLKAKRGKYIQVAFGNDKVSFLQTFTLGYYILWRKLLSTLHIGPEYHLFSVKTQNQSKTLQLLANYHSQGILEAPTILHIEPNLSLEGVKETFKKFENNEHGRRGKYVIQTLPGTDFSKRFLQYMLSYDKQITRPTNLNNYKF